MITRCQSLSARTELERVFAPFACHFRCEQSSVRLRVYERETGRTQLIIAGIPLSQIATSQNVAKLVPELRHEFDGSVFKDG